MRTETRGAFALIVALASVACASRNAGAARPPSEATPAPASLAPTLVRTPSIAPLLASADQRRLEILIGVPVDADDNPTLRRMEYRSDAEYFYPASAIKLCASVAALEKLSALRAEHPGDDPTSATPLRIHRDGGAPGELPMVTTIGQEVRRALIVSDNDAFNHLFDFVGYDELNTRLAQDGFASAHLRHHLGALGRDARTSPGVELLLPDGKRLLIPERVATLELAPTTAPRALIGQAYVDSAGRRIEGPMSFAEKNQISLRDLQDLLVAVVRPDLGIGKEVHLDSEDRELLVEALGTLPSGARDQGYAAGMDGDELHKPLLMNVRAALPGHRVRAFGKGGRAYGFVVQNSYLIDDTTGRSVFVAATLYTNANRTLNDDLYEYDEVARPFIKGLGELAAREFLE